MAKPSAPAFYPPRARWYTALFFRGSHRLRRHVALDQLHLKRGVDGLRVCLCIALPGYSFFAFGRPLLGWLFLAAYAAAALVFVATLGFLAASLAFGLLISIHASSIIYLEGHWFAESRFGPRLALGIGTLFAVWVLFYAPAVSFLEKHCVMPLRIGERVLVINCTVPASSLKRGDLVAYRIDQRDSFEGGRVQLQAGLGVNTLLGLPGDTLCFRSTGVRVNDREFPLAPHMPVNVDLVVPEKVWFIWPNLDMMVRGVTPAAISVAMQRAAQVHEDQIIGRPFKSWFGRPQRL